MPVLTGPYFARGLDFSDKAPAEPSFSAGGSAFAYTHAGENLRPGGSRGVRQVYLWRR